MYSPVWRLLTSQSVISKQNFSDSTRNKAQKPKENKFEVTSIAERSKAIEKLCAKKPFNIRLYVAHSVLLGASICG